MDNPFNELTSKKGAEKWVVAGGRWGCKKGFFG